MRKSFGYIIINILCAMLLITTCVFAYNAEKVVYVSVYKNPEFRTLVVAPRYTKDGYNIEKDIKELSEIEHVKDVYSSAYSHTVLYSPNLRSGFVDGTVTLKRYSNEVKVIKGNTITNNDTGVAICPTVFYTDSDVLNVDKKHARNGYKMLDKEFTVEYEDKTKTFKIVGVYSTSDILSDNGTCFVSEKDLKEIEDLAKANRNSKYNSMVEGVSALYVVVDDKDTLDQVKEKIESLEFPGIEDAVEIDLDFVNIIHLAPVSLFILILFVLYINTENYIYKRKRAKERYLEKVRTSELIKGNILMLIAGFLVFIVTYTILINTIPVLRMLDSMFEINLLLPLIIPAIIYIGLPLVIKK